MKNQLSLFVSIFILLGQLQAQAQTQIPNYVPTTGLVGWWPFNGNLNDQSGNANNGVLTGGQYVANRNGTANSALQFTSAATGYVDLNIGSTLTGQFSVMVWVRADRTSTFVSESGACPSTVSVPMANSNQNWLIRPGNLGTNFGVGISANQNGIMVGEHANNLLVSRLSHSFSSTAFNQIVVVYRSDSTFLYVNGTKVRSKVMHCPTSTKNIGSAVRFGGSIYSPNFAGVIDDIGIWNRALTQAEITGLYNAVEPFNTVASNAVVCAGQPVTLSVNALAGSITGLTCASATNNGILTAGVAASGVNSVVPYTGGNGGLHNGQTVTSTGVTGLTATLTAGTFASGIGNLTYTINGTPSGIGTASFALNIGGQTCILTRTVVAGTITALTCASATNNGTLTAGVAASGVNSVVPYTGGNGGMHNGQTVTSTGITGLTATLTAGTFVSSAGNLTYTITGTPASGGIASFALNIGGKTCTLTRTVNLPVGTIATLSCGTATNTGTLTAGTAASGVSSSVPYTGGNGGTNNGQTVTSTGVTGLTASLTAGTFASGAGNLTYTITGTPSASGTASFALNIGGKTCTLTRTVNYAYPTGTVHCAGSPTVVVEVTNPITGKIWMDRNLGATQVAISSTTAAAYGDLYQWGRRADGHQCRTSAITTTLSSVDQPAHGSFIKTINSTAASEYDWRVPQNSNLWQGVNGINNPCPLGFRLPTQTELNNERISWSTQNLAGSFSSLLKFTCAGGRGGILADLTQVGVEGYYWASTAGTNTSFFLLVRNVSPTMTAVSRSRASSVRCIKN